jgi:hypothetical protein
VSGTAGHFNSATQVLGEALREPEYSKHVEEPGSVYKVGGTMPVRQLQEKRTSILDGLRETVTRKDGTTYRRKLRNDAATLYTEIHSHPMPAADLLSNKKAHGSDIREWINHALADFTDRMPDDIDWSAVMHSDEGFVHFHIIAINTHDPKLDANKLHAGKVAAATLRDELDKYPQNTSPALRLNEGHKLAEFYSLQLRYVAAVSVAHYCCAFYKLEKPRHFRTQSGLNEHLRRHETVIGLLSTVILDRKTRERIYQFCTLGHLF